MSDYIVMARFIVERREDDMEVLDEEGLCSGYQLHFSDEKEFLYDLIEEDLPEETGFYTMLYVVSVSWHQSYYSGEWDTTTDVNWKLIERTHPRDVEALLHQIKIHNGEVSADEMVKWIADGQKELKPLGIV